MPFEVERARMLKDLRARGIRSQRVLEAFQKVPRHRFVEPALAHRAYGPLPLPIGAEQTISHPFVVAYVAQLLSLKGAERVLEVGTGSGYQTAILAELARKVYSIERHRELSLRARKVLDELGYHTVNLIVGDGSVGWPEKAPFDAILVSASYEEIPRPLLDQLKAGGKLAMPVGDERQYITLATRHEDGVYYERKATCQFVPLFGRHGRRPAG